MQKGPLLPPASDTLPTELALQLSGQLPLDVLPESVRIEGGPLAPSFKKLLHDARCWPQQRTVPTPSEHRLPERLLRDAKPVERTLWSAYEQGGVCTQSMFEPRLQDDRAMCAGLRRVSVRYLTVQMNL